MSLKMRFSCIYQSFVHLDAKAKHETKPSAKSKEAKEDKTSVFQKPTEEGAEKGHCQFHSRIRRRHITN